MIARVSIDSESGFYIVDQTPIEIMPDDVTKFLNSKEQELLNIVSINGYIHNTGDEIEVEFNVYENEDERGKITAQFDGICKVTYTDEVDGGEYEITEFSRVFKAALETAINRNWKQILKDNEPDYEPED